MRSIAPTSKRVNYGNGTPRPLRSAHHHFDGLILVIIARSLPIAFTAERYASAASNVQDMLVIEASNAQRKQSHHADTDNQHGQRNRIIIERAAFTTEGQPRNPGHAKIGRAHV